VGVQSKGKQYQLIKRITDDREHAALTTLLLMSHCAQILGN
jgi:hypothetical protein